MTGLPGAGTPAAAAGGAPPAAPARTLARAAGEGYSRAVAKEARRLKRAAVRSQGTSTSRAKRKALAQPAIQKPAPMPDPVGRAQIKAIALRLGLPLAGVWLLRTYCPELMKQGQLVLMMKNTAPIVGMQNIGEPFVGTNPICIGLPEANFIYDASTSTVATNKMRIYKKREKKFKNMIGINKNGNPTQNPEEILSEGYLLPFSSGPFWFKSFFLGVAIELMSSLAGGKTGKRIGEHRGKRLYSKEGMIAILIDKKAFPEYENYLKEKEQII